MIINIFDTETTGLLLPSSAQLSKQPKIIELGAIKYDTETEVINKLSLLINPMMKLPAIITKITGITDADLEEKATFGEQASGIAEFWEGVDVQIAHNATFDVGMLTNELKRITYKDFPWPFATICTVHEYTPIMGYRPKLINVYEHIMGKPLAQSHRAIEDCEAMLEMLLKDEFFEKINLDFTSEV